MIRIKKVDTVDDWVVDDLLWLHEQCFGNAATLMPEDTYGHWWLAVEGSGNAPVAFAALVPAAGIERTGYLKRCGVLPSHRGQGLQRRFVYLRERHARGLDWGRMVTDTTDNIRSANTLIRCGYRLFVPEHPWAWKPPETLYWEKTL